MEAVVTLAERQRRRMDAMRAALPVIDAMLAAYARERGGRFIRFGSSATGQLRLSSDIDIIADFPTHRDSVEASSFAEALCFAHDLMPDTRPSDWVAEPVLARAVAEGVVLA
jgi:predicted nucleotidyltransferase